MRLIHAFAALPLIAPAFGAFVLVDNMESGNNWTNIAGTTGVVADPAGGTNNVFRATAANGEARRSIPAIANNTTGTLFFRVYTTASGGDADWIFGSATGTNPTAFNSYKGYGRLATNTDTGIDMDVRNTGVAATPTTSGDFSQVGDASAVTWYNVWMVLNNTDDTTDMYFNTGGDATTMGTLSFTGAAFRTGVADGDLTSFLVRNNNNNTTGYIDDIYVDTSAQNLINPIPEPSVAVLLGATALLGLRRRRA